MGKVILKNGLNGFEAREKSSGSGLELHGDIKLAGKVVSGRPLGGVQRLATDADLTVAGDTQLLVLANDVSAARTISLPPAREGQALRAIFEVEQADNGGSFIFSRVGSDVLFGSISVKQEGNAAGDGNVEAGAITSVALTTGVGTGDTNIGSYIDFQCVRDGVWFVSGIVVTSDEDGTVAFS